MRDFVLAGDKSKPDSFERHVLKNAQDKKHDILIEAAGKSDFIEGQIKFDKTTSPPRLYTVIEDTLYYVTLTAA